MSKARAICSDVSFPLLRPPPGIFTLSCFTYQLCSTCLHTLFEAGISSVACIWLDSVSSYSQKQKKMKMGALVMCVFYRNPSLVQARALFQTFAVKLLYVFYVPFHSETVLECIYFAFYLLIGTSFPAYFQKDVNFKAKLCSVYGTYLTSIVRFN